MDEEKIQELDSIEGNELSIEYKKFQIILTIQDDDKKIAAMKKHIRNATFRLEIILTLSPERRLEHLEDFKSHLFQYKEEIIDSVEDDEIKKNYLKKAKDQEVITKVLMSIEDDTYNEDEENDNNDEQDEMMDITKKFAEEDEEEKLRRQRVREKFLNGYNKNNYEEDDENQDEDYVETPRKRRKGKRYK